jgi:SAM-dependent methyltransferase
VSHENLDDYIGAYGERFPFADENVRMLHSYAGYVIDSVGERQRADILSLGIGYQTVAARIVTELGERLGSYVILEGADAVIAKFKAQWPLERKPDIRRTYFEDFDSTERFDVIEMGFVLEHVDDPALIVRRFTRFLKAGGIIGMAVPNARSLHRLIGHEAGLLPDMYALSEHDRALGHKRYFDLASFRELAQAQGLVVKRARGIMLKPVTTSQLAALNLSESVMTALCKVADTLPDVANAMYIEVASP